jgi:hypothetical protein
MGYFFWLVRCHDQGASGVISAPLSPILSVCDAQPSACGALRSSVLGLALTLWSSVAAAQELEPRALSPAPVGTTFFLTGFGNVQGAVVVDPTVPVQDVEAEFSTTLIAGGYTFALWGRQARVLALQPYAWGSFSSEIGGQQQSRALNGLLDPRVKFSVGLVGAPALTPEEFARTPRRTVIGASLTIIAPTGEYDSTRLINLGFNRWAFKPEIGIWHPMGRWTLEGSAGIWFYTTNDSYFPGSAKRTQDPFLGLQAHVSYTFDNGAWIGLDGTWFSGGKTHVNETAASDRQNNTRLGATLSLPMSGEQSLKFIYSTGVATRRGADFDTFVVLWQLVMP